MNRSADGTGQFVEILVLGNGECGETFDLRGFIVDDNNGLLIPGNTQEMLTQDVQAPVYGQEGIVTGTDEFIEFANLDLRSNTSTVYVFYPGLTVEEDRTEGP